MKVADDSLREISHALSELAKEFGALAAQTLVGRPRPEELAEPHGVELDENQVAALVELARYITTLLDDHGAFDALGGPLVASREVMAELRDSYLEMSHAIELRFDVGIDGILAAALRELAKQTALYAGGFHVLELAERERRILQTLAAASYHKHVVGVMRYLAASVCDGVRRPGAWERAIVVQLFGDEAIEAAETEIEERYKRPPFRASSL